MACWNELRFEGIDTSWKQTIQYPGLYSQFNDDSIVYFGDVTTRSEQCLGWRSGEAGQGCWDCETYATVRTLKSCRLLRSVRLSTISFIKSCFAHLDAIHLIWNMTKIRADLFRCAAIIAKFKNIKHRDDQLIRAAMKVLPACRSRVQRNQSRRAIGNMGSLFACNNSLIFSRPSNSILLLSSRLLDRSITHIGMRWWP
jgi:hypothetical protein